MRFALTFLCFLSFAFASNAAKAPAFVFTPSTGEGPFPIVVWLHGYRGYSETGYFPNAKNEAMQAHADAIGAVIIGFPATTDLGDDTQQWSEEPVADQAYIQERLDTLTRELNVDRSRVVLFGFSQGAMVAGDLASLYPTTYLGAILMSPGGMGEPRASNIPAPLNASQRYFCFCGAEEHPGNVAMTKAYAEHFEKVLGSKVTLKLYPKMQNHARPPDFMKQFPNWISAILTERKPPPTQ